MKTPSRYLKSIRRFVTISVPAREGAYWFVFDTVTNVTVQECESRDAAAECCRLLNA